MAIDSKKISGGVKIIIFCIAGLIGLAVFFLIQSGDYIIFNNAWLIMKYLWWIILPIPMWHLFFMVWEEYAIVMFTTKQEYVILEIRPPADIEKSPKIMEQLYAGLHTWSTPNEFEYYCGWRILQDKFTFEIASTEGRVHFYIRCPKATRNNVEAQIYAQYPDAEIFEVEDYTFKLPKKLPNRDWDLWGTVLKLFNADALPIRTYKHFQEDVTGKMIDPFASLTEVMGNLGKGEHVWVQVIFTPAREDQWWPAGKEEVAKIMGQYNKKSGRWAAFWGDLGEIIPNVFRGIVGTELKFESTQEDEKKEFNIQQLSPGQKEQLFAIEENLSRPGFKALIRFVYIGKRDVFNKAMGVSGIMGAFKQFSDINLNSFQPDNRTKTYANYFFTKSRLAYRQRKIIQDFRDRTFQGMGYYFNTEELATVFHFPDMSVRTPAIDRITAKKGEAPANLPIGQI